MRYAAYGSNLHPLRLQERVPSATLLTCVNVPNWQLLFHKRGQDGSGKCSIARSEQSVYFAIFDMAAAHKPALDRAEGLNFGYEHTVLSIAGHGDCFAYVASHSHVEERLQPFSWYKELVLAGMEYHRLPAAYLQTVQAIESLVDTDSRRHAHHMELAARARASNPGPNGAA
jgi:gamma-glutamylcyclotransferase